MGNQFDDDEDPFLVTSDLEIRSILRTLQRQEILVRMFAAQNPTLSVMTTILGFDEDWSNVYVEASSDDSTNERLQQAVVIEFETQVNQASVSFTTGRVALCEYAGGPAFRFPLPASITRVQRREFFRVQIPAGEPINCMIPIVEKGQAPRRAFAKVKDISAGGVALLDVDNMLPHEPGITFREARLNLPELGPAVVDLAVVRVNYRELDRRRVAELGCQFIDPSSSSSVLIQSYISRLERRMIARMRGF